MAESDNYDALTMAWAEFNSAMSLPEEATEGVTLRLETAKVLALLEIADSLRAIVRMKEDGYA